MEGFWNTTTIVCIFILGMVACGVAADLLFKEE
jgi:hypothetical protein